MGHSGWLAVVFCPRRVQSVVRWWDGNGHLVSVYDRFRLENALWSNCSKERRFNSFNYAGFLHCKYWGHFGIPTVNRGDFAQYSNSNKTYL